MARERNNLKPPKKYPEKIKKGYRAPLERPFGVLEAARKEQTHQVVFFFFHQASAVAGCNPSPPPL